MIRYYPVLKWKRGEQLALRHLSEEQQSKITPIIEIVDAVSPEEFFRSLEGIACPIYIDTENIESGDCECLISFIKLAQDRDMPVYPVIPSSLIEAKDPPTDLLKKCLFRISVIPGEEELEAGEIIERIKSFGATEYGVILDIGPTIKSEYIGLQRSALLMMMSAQQDFLLSAQTVIICTSSFPSDIGDMGGGEERRYERHDFALFSKVASTAQATPLLDLLAYSDYGVSKFTETDLDFSKLRYGILPKIKYTAEDEYIVLKGKRQHGKLVVTYQKLAQAVIAAPYYSGREFSYGDECIYQVATTAGKSGNSTNWVTYCTNHHIVLVSQQISNLF